MKSRTALVIFVAVFSSCGSTKKTTATLTQTHIPKNEVKEMAVDGNDTDWDGKMQFSPGGTFQYGLASNPKDVFVVVKINSGIEQMKFLQGMELKIDPAGKDQKACTVDFPVKGEVATGGQFTSPATKGDDAVKMAHLNLRAQLVYMNCGGFKSPYNGSQRISGGAGLQAAVNWNSEGALIYELRIPINVFSTPPGDELSIGFDMDALERPSVTGGDSQGSGVRMNGSGMGGGMRGSGGGYRGGGGGGYRGSHGNGGSYQKKDNGADREKLREKESFWVVYGS